MSVGRVGQKVMTVRRKAVRVDCSRYDPELVPLGGWGRRCDPCIQGYSCLVSGGHSSHLLGDVGGVQEVE